MSQHFIRKNAKFNRAKRFYYRLREPRAVSAFYGVLYLTATVLGSLSVFRPPRTIDAVAGDTLMSVIAIALATGGIVGAITIVTGNYWLERYASAILLLGLVGYLFMVTYLAFTGTGNRYLSIMAILWACGCTGLRYFWTTTSPYNPDRRTEH